MATRIFTQSANPVQRPLQADGIFCAVAGLVFTLDAEPIRTFLGVEQAAPILILGLILLAYGIGLYFFATNRPIHRNIAIGVMTLNALWVIGSILLLIVDPFHFTNEGRWAILILSDVVAVIGIWEYLGIRRMARH